MSKRDDAIAAGVSAINAGVSNAIGSAYDQALIDNPPGTGGGQFSQADIDVAVAAAQDVDAQALAAAQADASAKLATLQTSLDALTAKEQLEEVTVANVQASIDSVQAAFDQVKAVLGSLTAPAPAPVDPTPAQPLVAKPSGLR